MVDFVFPLCELLDCKGLSLRSGSLCPRNEKVVILKGISVHVNLPVEVRRGRERKKRLE